MDVRGATVASAVREILLGDVAKAAAILASDLGASAHFAAKCRPDPLLLSILGWSTYDVHWSRAAPVWRALTELSAFESRFIGSSLASHPSSTWAVRLGSTDYVIGFGGLARETGWEHLGFVFDVLGRALETKLKARDDTEWLALQHQAFRSTALGFLVVTREGRSLFCSGYASTILQNRDGLLVKDGQLRATQVDSQARLEAALRAAPTGAQVVCIGRGPVRKPLILRLLRCDEDLDFRSSGRWVGVIFDPERSEAAKERLLKGGFGLTPAESRLASCLAEGISLQEACARLNIELTTAKSQLRHLLQKLDVDRQATLIPLLQSAGLFAE